MDRGVWHECFVYHQFSFLLLLNSRMCKYSGDCSYKCKKTDPRNEISTVHDVLLGVRLASIHLSVAAKSAAITSLAALGFPAFPEDERNNHEGRNRIGPCNVPNRVDSKANQSDQGQIGAHG